MTNTQSTLHNVCDHQFYTLLDELLTLRDAINQKANKRLDAFSAYYPGRRITKSAHNLAHYLSLRQYDLRNLQDQLAHIGLSSLGRSEAHVMATLNSVIDLLCQVEPIKIEGLSKNDAVGPDFEEGHRILTTNVKKMFGPTREYGSTHIMVTMPTEAANDLALVRSMLESGMDCARINCAHDSEDTWKNIINNIRQAAEQTGMQCKILMDLAGHKIRTGPVFKMPGVRHIKVKKDYINKKQTPVNIVLIDEDQILDIRKDSNESNYKLYVPKELHQTLAPGDRLVFDDIRGKQRILLVMYRIRGDYWLTHCNKSMYLADETPFTWERPDKNHRFVVLGKYSFRGIGEVPVEIRLYKDDRLRLTREPLPGKPAVHDDHGMCISHAHISCTTPEVLNDLKVGDPVWIDDGKL